MQYKQYRPRADLDTRSVDLAAHAPDMIPGFLFCLLTAKLDAPASRRAAQSPTSRTVLTFMFDVFCG